MILINTLILGIIVFGLSTNTLSIHVDCVCQNTSWRHFFILPKIQFWLAQRLSIKHDGIIQNRACNLVQVRRGIWFRPGRSMQANLSGSTEGYGFGRAAVGTQQAAVSSHQWTGERRRRRRRRKDGRSEDSTSKI